VWVAAERVDVVSYPAQRRLLILEAECACAVQSGKAEAAEDAEPVVDGDRDDVTVGGEPVGVEEMAGPDRAVAVDPHHDRLACAAECVSGRDDVQRQAVLVDAADIRVRRR
jgi:hypothetical protein